MCAQRAGLRLQRRIEEGEDALGPYVIVPPTERAIANAPTHDEVLRNKRECPACGRFMHVKHFRVPLTAAQSVARGKRAGVLATRDSRACAACTGVYRRAGLTLEQINARVYDGRLSPTVARVQRERNAAHVRQARADGVRRYYHDLRAAPWAHVRDKLAREANGLRTRVAMWAARQGCDTVSHPSTSAEATSIGGMAHVGQLWLAAARAMRDICEARRRHADPVPGFGDRPGTSAVDHGDPTVLTWHDVVAGTAAWPHYIAARRAWEQLPAQIKARVRAVPAWVQPFTPEGGRPLDGFTPLSTKPRAALAKAMVGRRV